MFALGDGISPMNQKGKQGGVLICRPVTSGIQSDYCIEVMKNNAILSDALKKYDNTEATCNDSNDEPNAECFIKAFDNCEKASIKNKVNTIEGDLVFYYLETLPDNDCLMYYTYDDSFDRFAGDGKGHNGYICSDIELKENKHYSTLKCEDSEFGFYLN